MMVKILSVEFNLLCYTKAKVTLKSRANYKSYLCNPKILKTKLLQFTVGLCVFSVR